LETSLPAKHEPQFTTALTAELRPGSTQAHRHVLSSRAKLYKRLYKICDSLGYMENFS